MTSALKRSVLATAVATLVAAPAYATNGMNMEAYGAKAGGMGGASMAYDSGNSAMMNNPATLALRKDGNNFGIGLTWLRPDVDAELSQEWGPAAGTYGSSGDSYLMPSVSFIRKSGPFAYGIGVLAQGGMGTDYDPSLAQAFGYNGASGPRAQRSELGFMRVMLPLAYQVNDSLSVAGQIDYVRGTLDMQMYDPRNGGAYIDVSDDSDFDGQMEGDGFAFKLGAHYKINEAWSVGATYHSETSIDDLKGDGTIAFDGFGGQAMPASFRMDDFQWPETYAIGAAWNVNERLMLAADIKRLMWSETMGTLGFSAVVPGMGGMEVPMPFPQNWDDQTVYMIGAQYMITPQVALRAGFNYADNPVPSETLHYLFPAIVEKHYTLGLGWNIGNGHTLAASLAYSPESEQTTPDMNAAFPGDQTIKSSHAQTTWRVNYNYNF